MEIAFSVITLFGMAYAAFRGLKWMLSVGKSQAKRDRILTPHDLKALEESAARLMTDLRTLTDECVARIEDAMARAECRLGPAGQPSIASQRETTLTGEVELVENLQKLLTTAGR